MYSDYVNKCRVCLENGTLICIFEDDLTDGISTKLMSLAKVEVRRGDGLPESICNKCLKNLNFCMEFIHLCQDSDLRLRSLNVVRKYSDTELSPKSESPKSPKLSIDETVQPQLTDEEIKNDDKDCGIPKNKRAAEKQQCYTCGKVMSSRFRLKTHMLTHSKERPFVCQYCNKSFTLSENLKVHLRTHTVHKNIGEKPFSCMICHASFAHTAGLAAHKRKHTGTLPYKCALCPRNFRTIGHLQYHTRRHTGERNFLCEICNKAFITKSDLKKHTLSHTGDKKYVCCICGLRLSRGSHLKRHIKAIHNSGKFFACSYCSNKFSQKSDVEKHMKEHENKRTEN